MATIQTVCASPDAFLTPVWGHEIRDAVAFKHGSFEPCIRQMQIDIRHGMNADYLPVISLMIKHGDAVTRIVCHPGVATRYDRRAFINAHIADWHENEAHAFEYAGN
jgi:hypothetical protein